MKRRNLGVLAAPIGAIIVWFTWLTPYHLMQVVANSLAEAPDLVGPPFRLTIYAMVGISGISLLAVGLTSASWQSLAMHAGTRLLLFLCTCGLAFTVVAIFYGNYLLYSAFVMVASVVSLEPKVVADRVNESLLPLHVGYAALTCSAILVLLASRVGSRSSSERRVKSPWSSRILALISLLVFAFATTLMVVHVSGFETVIGSPAPVKPDMLAGHVTAVLMSVFYAMVGLCGFGTALLIRAIGRSPA
jgi:uncharacterized membrane protein YuzA (DUF378 family)